MRSIASCMEMYCICNMCRSNCYAAADQPTAVRYYLLTALGNCLCNRHCGRYYSDSYRSDRFIILDPHLQGRPLHHHRYHH
jgi:hypothetical protein